MVVTLAHTGTHSQRCYLVNGGGQVVPDWLKSTSNNKKRRHKSDKPAGNGISLIQDFDFPEASNKVRSSPDGQYILATGTYKPRIKIWDLAELSLKSERVTDAENVDFVVLGDDWTKTLHLQTDRSVSVHTAASMHYSTRIPTHGRCIAYHYPSCDAVIGATGSSIYRLNLDQGRFLNSLECAPTTAGVSAIDINPAHGLVTAGTESKDGKGTVELWDIRSRQRAGILTLPYSSLSTFSSASTAMPLLDDPTDPHAVTVTSLASRIDGLNLAVGTSTGHTLLYDLRSTTPYTIKDQGYGLPIKKIEWCYGPTTENQAAGMVATADSKVIKIWGSQDGQNLISINPPSSINDFHIYPTTGVMMIANEASPMTAYFVPSLGPAPKWARFLENMTDEMDEEGEGVDGATVYEDYKFVSREELSQLALDHLIGTPTLKPYMHGFFIHLSLYTKARAIANPFAYAEHREKVIREKLEKEQASRIRGALSEAELQKRVNVKVNKELADRVRMREAKEQLAREKKEARKAAAVDAAEGEEGFREKEKEPAAASLLDDKRFKDLFENPEFEVDADSLEFAMLNPSTAARIKNKRQTEESEDEEEVSGSDGGNDSDSSDEGDLGQYDPRSSKQRSRPGQVDERTGKFKTATQLREIHAVREARAAKKARNPEDRPRLVEDTNKGKNRSGRQTPRGSSSGVMREIEGGMEYTFQPETTAADDKIHERELRAKQAAKKRRDETMFGAGLRKGSDREKEQEKRRGEELGGGRTQRRKVSGLRSASRNKTRNL